MWHPVKTRSTATEQRAHAAFQMRIRLRGADPDRAHYLACHANTLLCDQVAECRFLRQFADRFLDHLVRAVKSSLASQRAAALLCRPACVNPPVDNCRTARRQLVIAS